jgi:hypothetical protein
MPVDRAVEIAPITPLDRESVAEFLHHNLNGRVSQAAWTSAVVPPWKVDAPNHGFLLRCDGRVVGVHLAFYSRREVNGELEDFCNLGAWCVLEEHRAHSVRLLRALLAQRGYHFTDLSPSGGVVPLNERLKFRHLDTSTVLVPNVLRPFVPGRFVIESQPRRIEERLTGRDLEIYLDHAQAAAAHHVVVTRGSDSCYVMFRRDRRRGIPVFASILFVGNHELFHAAWPRLSAHLLVRHRVLATLAELRIVGRRPRLSVMLARPRPKMFRSSSLGPEHIDNLYSELACVAW